MDADDATATQLDCYEYPVERLAPEPAAQVGGTGRGKYSLVLRGQWRRVLHPAPPPT